MEEINIDEVQTPLPALVARAVAGEPFIITKDGQPLVTVSAYEEPKKCPRIGFLNKKYTYPVNFVAPETETGAWRYYDSDDLNANIDPELLKELGYLPKDFDTSKIDTGAVIQYDNDNIFANIDPELLREMGYGPED